MHHRNALTDPVRSDEYQKLRMNQARYGGVTASMLGKENAAVASMQTWGPFLSTKLQSDPQVNEKALPEILQLVERNDLEADPWSMKAFWSFASRLACGSMDLASKPWAVGRREHCLVHSCLELSGPLP